MNKINESIRDTALECSRFSLYFIVLPCRDGQVAVVIDKSRLFPNAPESSRWLIVLMDFWGYSRSNIFGSFYEFSGNSRSIFPGKMASLLPT